MKIKVHQIGEEGLILEGEDLPSILEFSEPLFRFEKPIRYQLSVNWVGDNDLLVCGRLSSVVKAQCVRTLEWFDMPIVVDNFECHIEVKDDEADLTQEIREDILLALPSNPVLPDAKPLAVKQPPELESGNKVWGKLDRLKIK